MNSAQYTTDYSLFQSILSNREVDNKHVKRLVSAIKDKNLLHVNPILCNSKMEVIDGQHRLEAAKILNIPIYYQVDDHISKNDIAAINSNKLNWSTMDYINYWAVEKALGFDKLCSFISQHPLIPPSTVLMLLSAGGKRDIASLKQGVIDLSNYEKACKVADIIKEFRNMIDFAYERNFILAINKIVGIDGYDHSIMQSKLEFMSRELVKCINTARYVEMLLSIYNYRSSKNTLKF